MVHRTQTLPYYSASEMMLILLSHKGQAAHCSKNVQPVPKSVYHSLVSTFKHCSNVAHSQRFNHQVSLNHCTSWNYTHCYCIALYYMFKVAVVRSISNIAVRH